VVIEQSAGDGVGPGGSRRPNGHMAGEVPHATAAAPAFRGRAPNNSWILSAALQGRFSEKGYRAEPRVTVFSLNA
jgi:hypothetical protein